MSPRQRIASSAYALRAEEADNAANADTVGNVSVSTTPAPNKLLPLNSDSKMPLSTVGLKVYDSGWFAVGQSGSWTKTHNLGTEKSIVQIIGSPNLDGSGAHYLISPYYDVRSGGDIDRMEVSISPTQITVSTDDVGIIIKSGVRILSVRIIMLALEL